ncbi:MAG: DUF3105 domain-containing protein [Actinomycetes bacterium]
MANKTKQQEKDRRAKVEAMRREQEARERRKSLLIIVTAVVVGLGLVAAAVVPGYLDKRNDPANKAPSSFGVDAASAQCDEPTTDKTTGTAEHVGPGTNQPDKTKVDYAEVPPSSGAHYARPAFPAKSFYTADDRPQMEELVHNLKHGYTVLWYDDTIKGEQLQTLRDLSSSAREQDAVGSGKKFIVSAWDDSYGDLPQGKHVALSHWGAKEGHRQLCGKVSGEVVQEFIDAYPATDAPEPNAA